MSQSMIALGASPYLEPIKFSAVNVGDTVVTRHNDKSLEPNSRLTVEAVEKGAIRLRNVWYRKADGWKLEVLITPATVEVKEPHTKGWWDAFRGNEYASTHLVTRTLVEAETMVTLHDIKFTLMEEGFTKFKALGTYDCDWDQFAKAVKVVGIKRLESLLDAPYKEARAKTLNRSFYNAVDENDAITQALSLLVSPRHYTALKRPYPERVLFWLASFAVYGQHDTQNAKEVAFLIDAFGIEPFFALAGKIDSFEELTKLAQTVGDNGIDEALLESLLNGKEI